MRLPRAREHDHLLGAGERAWHVEQPRRQAQRAFLHRLTDQRRQLSRCRLAIVVADDTRSDSPVAHVDRPVGADRQVGNLAEVLTDRIQGAPIVALGQRRDTLQQRVVRCRDAGDSPSCVRV